MDSQPKSDHRTLKRKAHHLKPIVRIGAAGLTTAVLAELDQALIAHKLVKIRLDAPDRQSRATMIARACENVAAECVQQIGHTATLYRSNPETSEIEPPVSQ
mgnify:CR=1 FL=1